MKYYLEFFKALSDKTRLRIFRLLCRFPHDMCVCEIVDGLQESQYKVSRHLKVLKYAKLVQETKKGKWVYYELAKLEDPYLQNLILPIINLQDNLFLEDEDRLNKRLALRVDGECVVGMDGCKAEKLSC